MTSDFRRTIADIQKAQDANNRAIAATKYTGALGEAVGFVLGATHAYAVAITHRVTGALAASHRMKWELAGRKASIFVDPSAVNPFGQKPSIYGPIEESRGGSHAFYERSVEEPAPMIADGIASIFVRRLR